MPSLPEVHSQASFAVEKEPREKFAPPQVAAALNNPLDAVTMLRNGWVSLVRNEP
ncbi:MAG: hypothetical protein RLZZ519_3182 [Bacteroidota bacterium]|jgi:hypothetical protein